MQSLWPITSNGNAVWRGYRATSWAKLDHWNDAKVLVFGDRIKSFMKFSNSATDSFWNTVNSWVKLWFGNLLIHLHYQIQHTVELHLLHFSACKLWTVNILSFPVSVTFSHFLVSAAFCRLNAKAKIKTLKLEVSVTTDSSNRRSRIGTTVCYCWITQFLYF